MRHLLHHQPKWHCEFEQLEERALLSYGFGAPHDGKLSLTFLGDLYPLTSDGTASFLADVQTCQDALKTIEPYTSRFNQFEFHTLPLGPLLGITSSSNPMADYATVDQIVTASGITTDVAVVLVKNPFTGGTGEHQIPVLTNGMGMPGTFIHELSHALGIAGDPQVDAYNLLLDEYVYGPATNKPHDNQVHQNIYAGDPNLGMPPQWADLVAPDEYSLGATYANWYRPSPRSMMHSPANWYFNSVSHRLLKEGLDYWAGAFNDPVAPSVEIVGLSNDDIVSGVVQVSTSLSDNVGVVRTQLWVDDHLARNAYSVPFDLAWTTGGLAPGSTHTVQVKAFDAAGNVGVSTAVRVRLDKPADLSFSSPTSDLMIGGSVFSATISAWVDPLHSVKVWIDDDTAHTQKDYAAPFTLTLSTNGLTPGTHQLTAVAYGLDGVTEVHRTTSLFNYEPLIVAIASPAADASVGGIVPVVIDVTQGHPTRMELTYGNRSATETTLVLDSAPWVFSWDTLTAPNFTEGLFLKAYEGTGSVLLPARIVNVANGAGSIDEPTAGATLSGTPRVGWNASNRFVHRVEFRVDGNLVDFTTHDGYSGFDWNTLTTTNGPHTLSFVASNTYGWSQTYEVSVTVQNAQVTLASPLPDATVSGVTPVELLDPTGKVAKVSIFVDNQAAFTIGQAPFTWTWDTRSLADGLHTVRVDHESPGGVNGSFVVPVTVDNIDARFTKPAPNAIVRGRTPVALTVLAGQVTRATFGFDVKTLGHVVKAPFSLTWDTTKAKDGSHGLWARVYNPWGGSDLVAQAVQVRNDRTLPTVTLTSPAARARLGATAIIRGRASDRVGIARVDVLLDNLVIASTIPSTTSFTIAVDFSSTQLGSHKLRLRAVDRSGNVGQSAVINVTRI